MRLLNANTLEFEEFHKNAKPPYIILSHTWGPEEVSYQDMCWLQKLQKVPQELKSGDLFRFVLSVASPSGSAATEEEITRRSGYDKIVQMARIATSRNYTYFWIDTCCIDKSSSSELQESINSMYHWYQDSNMCFVYLEDGEPLSKDFAQHEKEFRNIISKSRWITRGWTLQELIAPRAIVFSDRYWKVYHLNKPLQNQIVSESAKVPSTALGSGNLGAYSVAQKFSWAASRSTTRIEDEAYCLLGLFDIHMPMLYGEGQKAFVRLQEQLVQTSNDDSLFAWRSSDSGPYIHRGLLARSPREFADCGYIKRGEGSLAQQTNFGLRLSIPMKSISGHYLVRLGAAGKNNKRIGIMLQRLDKHNGIYQYARIFCHSHFDVYDNDDFKTTIGTFRQSLQIPPGFSSPGVHSFQLRIRQPARSHFSSITEVWPPQCWNEEKREIIIDEGAKEFITVLRFDHTFSTGHFTLTLILGLERATGLAWCKIAPTQPQAWPSVHATAGIWEKAIKANRPNELKSEDQHYYLRGSVKVKIKSGLEHDRFCRFVYVNGFP